MTAEARAVPPVDFDELAALYGDALTGLQGLRGGPLLADGLARQSAHATSLARRALEDDCLVLVGTYADAVVGFVCARLEQHRHPGDVAVLEALYVLPEARELGVGHVLLTSVRDWAHRLGCVGIDAVALPGDRATKSFFESEGLRARLVVMHGPVTRPLRATASLPSQD